LKTKAINSALRLHGKD